MRLRLILGLVVASLTFTAVAVVADAVDDDPGLAPIEIDR